MAYATYRLHYETEFFDEDAYEDACAFFDDDADEQVDPDDFYVDDSFCAAIIVVDIDPAPGEQQEVQLAIKPPGGPHTPDWYGPEEAELVAQELGHIIHAKNSKTVEIRHPRDPSLDLEVGAVVDAEDLSAATLMAMDPTEMETRMFPAFCIEYQPNDRTESFPIAVFALDPVDTRLIGGDFGPQNPFAPRSYSLAQRRYVDRQLTLFTRKLTRAAAQGPEGGLARLSARDIMGPQFRTEMLPPMTGTDVQDAMNQACAFLRDYWERAS